VFIEFKVYFVQIKKTRKSCKKQSFPKQSKKKTGALSAERSSFRNEVDDFGRLASPSPFAPNF